MRASPWIAVAVLVFTGVAAPAGEAATLAATFTTTSNGGQYAPANIVAVWVEGPGGTFVKTIGRWSLARTSSLIAWKLKAGAADTDAVSGATRSNHTPPLTVTWNLLDRAGQVIPDGTYTIRMELADSNASTAAQNRQGTFTFVKSATPQMQSGLASGGFNNVSINFDPANTTPPPSNPPPSNPPPSGGGVDAGVGASSYDAVEGGCAAGGSGAGLSLGFGVLIALSGSSRLARRRSRSR
jgi:hypothetical protein